MCPKCTTSSRVTLKCPVCGITFERVLSPIHVARAATQQPCCSHACAAKLRGKRWNLEDYFWRKVKRGDGCWLWEGPPHNRRGYCAIQYRGKFYLAHRVSWMIHYGDIPGDMLVCHHCDNPRCVNPEHLFLGTPNDNVSDMISKGRQAAGQSHPLSRLTEADVRTIRERYAAGTSQSELAREYGCRQTNISNIVRRKTWKHV